MSISYLQSFLSLFPINQSLSMNQNVQHCFLLDGKTILPIDRNHQLFISLKNLNNTENKYCPCYQRKYRSYSSNEKLKANNNNKHDQINEEDLCSCSLKSIEKLSERKHRKFPIVKRTTCKHHYSDQQINNNKPYLTNPIIPSINFTIDSTQINNNQSPSAITIIIKPFTSLEDHQNLKKRKNSSSLETTTKRVCTFKDITRTILPISTPMNLNENRSSNILKSRTLFDIYCNKKQHLIEK